MPRHETAPGDPVPRELRCPAKIWLLELIFLALGLWCQPLGAAQDVYSSEFEKSPSVSFYDRDMNRRLARERQELYRKRVAIPDAVGRNVPSPVSARQAAIASRTPSLGEPLEMQSNNLWIVALLFLTGILAIRRLAPELAAYFNERLNPWALSPPLAVSLPVRVRAEEEAFAEYLLAFQSGPSGKPQTPPLDASTEQDSLKEFLAGASRILAESRTLLQEIGRTSDVMPRQEMVAELHRKVRALKGEAGLTKLPPFWQTVSALEGLLRQLSEKAGNVTLSTLRTVAGGVDLLNDMCKLGVEVDLLANPPLRLLAVDDDLISRKAVSFALQRALNPPDLAENGESALALATKTAYDVIFLDVQMPGMDGFELCTQIHETLLNKTTPVIFVTCMSDFNSRVQSALNGGSELMGKPFLTFEITVKALTLSLRNRLQARAGARVAGAGHGSQACPPPVAWTPALGPSPAIVRTNPADIAPPSLSLLPAMPPQPARPNGVRELSSDELTRAFLGRASVHLGPLRELMQATLQAADAPARQELLEELYLRLNSLTPQSGPVPGHPAIRLNAALEGLFKKLLENSKHCTSSTLLTAAAAVDLLNDLCVTRVKADLASNPSIRLLVVDDDPVARRAITCALQMAFKKPDNAGSGEAALTLAAESAYDVIFMDVQMPGMDGFAACSRIRQIAPNCSTPVVFVTAHADMSARDQWTRSGGNDLMGKPFLTAEITVKALTFALRGRLQKLQPATNVIQLQAQKQRSEPAQCRLLPAAS